MYCICKSFQFYFSYHTYKLLDCAVVWCCRYTCVCVCVCVCVYYLVCDIVLCSLMVHILSVEFLFFLYSVECFLCGAVFVVCPRMVLRLHSLKEEWTRKGTCSCSFLDFLS